MRPADAIVLSDSPTSVLIFSMMPSAKALRTEVDRDYDNAVGARIRSARLAAGLNQTQLASAIGVTFQQLQKYEKGTNRVAASRLAAIARTLGLSPSAFLDPQEGVQANSPEASQIARLYDQCSESQQRVIKGLLMDMAANPAT